MSKYLKFLKQASSEVQLAVCPISGLQITIQVPIIPDLVYDYPSPLSFFSNAISIAKLQYNEKTKLQRQVLAGACLTIMNHYGVIEDKLSAVERNMLLCECSPYILHSLSYIFVSNSKSKIEAFPHFSFASLITESAAFHNSSTIEETIQSYIKACTENEETKVSPISIKIKTGTRKAPRSTSQEARKAIKNYTATLQREGFINSKVAAILSLVAQRNNLYTMNLTIREKLLEKLDSIEHECAALLASIIKAASSDDEDITQHFQPEGKRSLADILKAKIEGREVYEIEEEQEEQEQEQSYSIVEELIQANEELETEDEEEDDDEF